MEDKKNNSINDTNHLDDLNASLNVGTATNTANVVNSQNFGNINNELEERIKILSKKDGDVPLIHTMESDVYDNIRKENIDKIKILSGQMDAKGILTSGANSSSNNKNLWIISAAIFIFLLILAGGVYYYYTIKNKVVPAPVVIETPKYTIKNVWNDSLSSAVFDPATIATSTDNTVVVNINNFEQTFPAILQSETKFETLARSKFGYESLSTFTDLTISNINMRIADGGSGSFIYGYVDTKYLIITNNIGTFIDTYNKYKSV